MKHTTPVAKKGGGEGEVEEKLNLFTDIPPKKFFSCEKRGIHFQ
jgi:hypothetical protein